MNITSLYRRRLSKEKGSIKKKKRGRLSVALIYPNIYHVGMSNLGFQVVYKLLNEDDNIVAERFFLPTEYEFSYYKSAGLALCSLESQIPLNKFDIIAFSLSFENDYINILKILELGDIPLLSEDRYNLYPIVIAGGIATFLNPEPISPFIDMFIMGEAEVNLNKIMNLFIENMNKFSQKKDLLLFLAKNQPNIYVPSFYNVEYKKDGTISSFYPKENGINDKILVPKKIPLNTIAYSKIISLETEFSNRRLIEIARGCGRSCRFCAAGYVYRPPRYHKSNDIIDIINTTLKETNYIGLLSASISDVPEIKNILKFINEEGGNFSISSVRADTISEEFLDYIKRTGQRRVTIAPEAGSERLRKVINKHMSKENILRAVSLIAKEELSIKLYFMIGLPTEQWEDIEGILKLSKLIRHCMVKEGAPKGKVGDIRLNISCFVPKPFTPFQWHPMDSIENLKKKQKWLLKTIKKEGGIRISFDVPKWAYIQTLLSLGDRRVASILLLVHKSSGNWNRAFKYSEVNPNFFVYRKRDTSEILPWDFIEHYIHKDYLRKEYTKALSAIESEICYSTTKCKKCGVCASLSL